MALLVRLTLLIFFANNISIILAQLVSRLNETEVKIVIDLHNEARKAVGATNMKKISWSDTLADKASQIVAQCQFRHSVPTIDASELGYEHIGENVFATSSNVKPLMEMVVQSFVKEKIYFDSNTGFCLPTNKGCGHYTQVIWANTESIGCAISACEDIPGTSWSGTQKWIITTKGYRGGHLVTCLYGPGGNYKGTKPYAKSDSVNGICSKCDSYKKDGVPYSCDGDGLCGPA